MIGSPGLGSIEQIIVGRYFVVPGEPDNEDAATAILPVCGSWAELWAQLGLEFPCLLERGICLATKPRSSFT